MSKEIFMDEMLSMEQLGVVGKLKVNNTSSK